MWFLFSCLCAFFFATQGAWIKKLSFSSDRRFLTWAMFAFGIPFLVAAAAFRGLPAVERGFWLPATGSLFINMVAFSFFVRAITVSSLALTFPFLAFTPVFLILTGFILLGEMPDIFGIAGIFFVAGGAYVLNLPDIKKGIFTPLKAIKKEKGSMLMLGVSALWSVAAALDKRAVLTSGPIFYPLVFNAGFALFYLPFLEKKLSFTRDIKPRPGGLLFLGLLGSIMVVFQMEAINIAYASYVIAIKRSGMIFTMVMGILFFREEFSWSRLAGTVLMVMGVTFIGIFGN